MFKIETRSLQGCEDCGAWFSTLLASCPACLTAADECHGCGAPPIDNDAYCLDCLDTISAELSTPTPDSTSQRICLCDFPHGEPHTSNKHDAPTPTLTERVEGARVLRNRTLDELMHLSDILNRSYAAGVGQPLIDKLEGFRQEQAEAFTVAQAHYRALKLELYFHKMGALE